MEGPRKSQIDIKRDRENFTGISKVNIMSFFRQEGTQMHCLVCIKQCCVELYEGNVTAVASQYFNHLNSEKKHRMTREAILAGYVNKDMQTNFLYVQNNGTLREIQQFYLDIIQRSQKESYSGAITGGSDMIQQQKLYIQLYMLLTYLLQLQSLVSMYIQQRQNIQILILE
ncbi:Hypothetical_protein [Hexamita inflata]|uniref:Hypothetical_protein n=1 Tax=Hexamita inflata TaxID=28002 RepID=A0AA86TNV2_9EUKA|nr:Hypothetical protein HINF_LOCUS10936 [Hexamita inflata]